MSAFVLSRSRCAICPSAGSLTPRRQKHIQHCRLHRRSTRSRVGSGMLVLGGFCFFFPPAAYALSRDYNPFPAPSTFAACARVSATRRHPRVFLVEESMRVPFLDLQAHNRSVADAIRAAIDPVLDDAQFILGPAVSRFE